MITCLCIFMIGFCFVLGMLVEEHNRLVIHNKELRKELNKIGKKQDDICGLFNDLYKRQEKLKSALEADYSRHMKDMNYMSKRLVDIERRLNNGNH